MPEDQPVPQGAPPQGAQEEAQEGGGASQLVSSIFQGMSSLEGLLSQSGAGDPEDSQKLQMLMSAFQEFVEGLGQPKGAKPAQQGPATSSPEAGANPNAKPMGY